MPDPTQPDAPPRPSRLEVWIVVRTNDGVCLLEESDNAELARRTLEQIRAERPPTRWQPVSQGDDGVACSEPRGA